MPQLFYALLLGVYGHKNDARMNTLSEWATRSYRFVLGLRGIGPCLEYAGCISLSELPDGLEV